MTIPSLPELPCLSLSNFERVLFVRSATEHGEACYRAGLERAAQVCREQIRQPGMTDNPASIHFKPAEAMARFCAAAIRAEAAKEAK